MEPLSSAPEIWANLVAELQRISEVARKIQVDGQFRVEQGLTDEEINDFASEYLDWYAKCLALLPASLQSRFRVEYEKKIKYFVMRPAATDFFPHIQRFDDMGDDFIYSYAKWFYEPSFAQKQILLEASKLPMQLIPASVNAINIIEKLAKSFHRVVLQMRERYDNRPSFIELNDEYDVQDLFYTMLLPFFSDIRREEQTPSFAGSPSRIDFLLKNEQIAIEIKKTRRGLGKKRLGEELIVDIQRYRTHVDFKTLIAFVYDPDRYIKHPEGIENDLNGTSEGVNVKIFIVQS